MNLKIFEKENYSSFMYVAIIFVSILILFSFLNMIENAKIIKESKINGYTISNEKTNFSLKISGKVIENFSSLSDILKSNNSRLVYNLFITFLVILIVLVIIKIRKDQLDSFKDLINNNYDFY